MIINTVRVNKKQVHINYDVYKNDSNEKYDLLCDDKPNDSFYLTLAKLKRYYGTILELPAKYCDSITCKGIELRHKTDKNGVKLVGEKTVSEKNQPFNIITPYQWEDEHNTDLFDIINEIVTEAIQYVDGNRTKEKLNGSSEQTESLPFDEEEA
jgi:hypothetical protein